MSQESYLDGPDDEVRLPRTPESNDFLSLADGTIEYSKPPRSPEELYAHAADSMMAIGIMQANAIKRQLREEGEAAPTTESAYFYQTEEVKTEAEPIAKHDLSEYGDYYAVPLPVPGLTGQYTDRKDEHGKAHAIVQIQPIIAMPDLPEDASFIEINAALNRYKQQLVDRGEYVWDSAIPQEVRLHHGTESHTLDELSVGDLMSSARFLRRVAITTALIQGEHEMLERLLPPEHEVKGVTVPLGIARAAAEQRQNQAETVDTDE
jgi:hypothetical protein